MVPNGGPQIEEHPDELNVFEGARLPGSFGQFFRGNMPREVRRFPMQGPPPPEAPQLMIEAEPPQAPLAPRAAGLAPQAPLGGDLVDDVARENPLLRGYNQYVAEQERLNLAANQPNEYALGRRERRAAREAATAERNVIEAAAAQRRRDEALADEEQRQQVRAEQIARATRIAQQQAEEAQRKSNQEERSRDFYAKATQDAFAKIDQLVQTESKAIRERLFDPLRVQFAEAKEEQRLAFARTQEAKEEQRLLFSQNPFTREDVQPQPAIVTPSPLSSIASPAPSTPLGISPDLAESGQANLAAIQEEERQRRASRKADAQLRAQIDESDRQERERKDIRNAKDKQRREDKRVVELKRYNAQKDAEEEEMAKRAAAPKQKPPSAAALMAQAANERAAKAVAKRNPSPTMAATPSPLTLSSPPPMSPSPMAVPKTSKRTTGNTPSAQAGREVAAATGISKNITARRPSWADAGAGAGAVDAFGNEAKPPRDSSSLGQSRPSINFGRSGPSSPRPTIPSREEMQNVIDNTRGLRRTTSAPLAPAPSPAITPLPTPDLGTPTPETPPLGTPGPARDDPFF
jgi:hypothetical protein